jgi:hypothetical protein
MIAQASGFGIGLHRFSRPLRGVGVLAMLDAGLDTTRHLECVCKVPLRAGELRLLVPALVVGVFIEGCSVAVGVEATH